MKFIILTALFFSAPQVFAWGGRGHDSICEIAAFLVKEEGLKEYLRNKPHMMGHLCNIPDFHWKSLGGDVNQAGNSTHFIDIEVIGLEVKDIPTDFKKLQADFTGKPNKFKNDGTTIKSIPQEFGSAWWRADQFMRNIAALKEDFSKAVPPANRKEEQNDELLYNKTVYQMAVSMGLLGHFVADNSQPFHTTADYDGYTAGHGGIHSFYEDAVVSEFGADLQHLIYQESLKMKNAEFLKPKTTIEKMKVLSVISNKEIPKLLKMDPITKKSEVKSEKGMEIRSVAERKDASVAFKKMKPMIVTQMARSAVLLANLWDEAYVSVGRPSLKGYKSYRYPFTPDFVKPDYINELTEKK